MTKTLSPTEQKVLEMYREWLNAWFAQDDIPPLNIEDFFEHGETYHLGFTSSGWYDIWTFSAGYGDDGGPAVLTAWVNADGYPGGGSIHTIVQDFDTDQQFIYLNGSWQNKP
jgi:hypothetical protein